MPYFVAKNNFSKIYRVMVICDFQKCQKPEAHLVFTHLKIFCVHLFLLHYETNVNNWLYLTSSFLASKSNCTRVRKASKANNF